MTAATNLAEVTKEEADQVTSELDAREKADLDTAYGVVERGRRPREYAPALSALEKGQRTRAKRRHLDMVDRGLMDLVSVYRDAIAVATARVGMLVNEEIRGDVEQVARTSTPELNLQRIARDLRRARADAGVQRPVRARPGVDDGRPQGPRRGEAGDVRRGRAGASWSCWWPVGLALLRRRHDADAGRAAGAPAPCRPRRPGPAPTEPPKPDLAAFYAQKLLGACRGERRVRDADRADRLPDPAGATIELALLKVPAADPGAADRLAGRQPGRPGRARARPTPQTASRPRPGAPRRLRHRRLRPARHR